MDKIRRNERNKLIQNIKLLNSIISNKTNSIDNLRVLSDTEFTRNQLEKLKIEIQEKTDEIQEINERINNLEQGILDNELSDQIKLFTKEAEKKTTETKNRKKKLQNTNKPKGRYNSFPRKASEREMGKSYNHFLKTIHNIPEYITKKLNNMESNKGYVWRNVHLYGSKQISKETSHVMFEKRKGDLLVITESSETEKKTWYKYSKQPKQLYSVEVKKKKIYNDRNLI